MAKPVLQIFVDTVLHLIEMCSPEIGHKDNYIFCISKASVLFIPYRIDLLHIFISDQQPINYFNPSIPNLLLYRTSHITVTFVLKPIIPIESIPNYHPHHKLYFRLTKSSYSNNKQKSQFPYTLWIRSPLNFDIVVRSRLNKSSKSLYDYYQAYTGQRILKIQTRNISITNPQDPLSFFRFIWTLNKQSDDIQKHKNKYKDNRLLYF